MDIRKLEYFVAVAEHLSFTEAAKRLYVGQSAISQQIKELEHELGVQLFFRNKRSVQLTGAGRVFLVDAREILNKVDAAMHNVQNAEHGIVGSLDIGLLAGPVFFWLPAILNQFRRLYPLVNVRLHHLPLSQLNEPYKRQTLDVIFTVALGLDKVAHLQVKTLYSDAVCVYVPEGHPLAHATDVNLESLCGEGFIMRCREEAPQWYDYTLFLCAESGFSPTIVSETKHVETVMILVAAGFGIAIFPHYLRMYAPSGVRALPLTKNQKPISVDVVASWMEQHRNPVLARFLELIQ